jgi:hypothetical protein
VKDRLQLGDAPVPPHVGVESVLHVLKRGLARGGHAVRVHCGGQLAFGDLQGSVRHRRAHLAASQPMKSSFAGSRMQTSLSLSKLSVRQGKDAVEFYKAAFLARPRSSMLRLQTEALSCIST